MITQERVDILSEILNSDQLRARKLLGLQPNIAVEEINALGHDFTLDEIKAYGSLLKTAQKKYAEGEELSLDALDEVAGGGTITIFTIRISIKW